MRNFFKKASLVVGAMFLSSQVAMADRVIPADFTLLNADVTADIGAVAGALIALLGVILVAKLVIGFVKGR